MESQSLRIIFAPIFMLSIFTVADAAIVDVNARSNNLSNPVEIFLDAGTYVVTPIGVTDGGAFDSWSPWAGTSCTNIDGCERTTPTTVTGWVNIYSVISPDITAVSIEGTTLPPVDSTLGLLDYFLVSDTETRYYVDDGMVYPNSTSALAFARESAFILSSPGFVGFAITDGNGLLGDNRGGMSLSVSSVPLPGAVWLFGSGFLGLIGLSRRKKAA